MSPRERDEHAEATCMPPMFSSGEARAGAARTISEAQNFASVLSLIAKIKIVL